MANYPTGLDTFTDPTAGQKQNSPSHSGEHTLENDAILALETKVGIDGSAVVTSIDYLLKNTTGGHNHDGAGSRLIAHNYKARVYRGTTNQSIASGVQTKIQFNTKTRDPSNSFDIVTNYRFTVPTGGDGDYLVIGSILWSSPTTGRHITQIWKNGANYSQTERDVMTGATYESSTVVEIVPLVATDYIELYVYQNAVASETILADVNSSYLSIERIG